MARVPSPVPLTEVPERAASVWRHTPGRFTLAVLRLPGSLVAGRFTTKTGESRFGPDEERMIIRTLIDVVVGSVAIVVGAWVLFS